MTETEHDLEGTVVVHESQPLIPLKNSMPSDVSSTSNLQQFDPSSPQRLFQGRVILFVVALIYGSLNVSLRVVYERPDPPTASAISTSRGWLAVLCFLPLLRFSNSQEYKMKGEEEQAHLNANENVTGPSPSVVSTTKSVLTDHDEYEKEVVTITPTTAVFWRFALELALFNFGTQALINVGLVTIESSARASFLTQLSVVITPVLSAIFGHKVHCRVWFACIMALVGLYILSVSHASSGGHSDDDVDTSTSVGSSNSSSGIGLSMGDLCCLGGALCWSYYIYRMSEWGDFFDEITVQFWKNIFLASMYTIWMLIAAFVSPTSLWPGIADWVSWFALFYSALFPCAIADILQQKGQAVVPAAESNVIMSLEPVFTGECLCLCSVCAVLARQATNDMSNPPLHTHTSSLLLLFLLCYYFYYSFFFPPFFHS